MHNPFMGPEAGNVGPASAWPPGLPQAVMAAWRARLYNLGRLRHTPAAPRFTHAPGRSAYSLLLDPVLCKLGDYAARR